MSDPEKKKSVTADVGSMVMVEKPTSGRHHKPCPSNELSEATDHHHKRSKAPAAHSVAEALKNVAENSTLYQNETATEERKENVQAKPSEKHKHSVAKNLSSSTKREPSPETIALASLDKDKKSPIPLDVQTDEKEKEKDKPSEKIASKNDDTDSIVEEITELQPPKVVAENSEWAYDEEAGGLPRSESRGSRVSQAMRQLFCCGVPYEAPSEDSITTHRFYPI